MCAHTTAHITLEIQAVKRFTRSTNVTLKEGAEEHKGPSLYKELYCQGQVVMQNHRNQLVCCWNVWGGMCGALNVGIRYSIPTNQHKVRENKHAARCNKQLATGSAVTTVQDL